MKERRIYVNRLPLDILDHIADQGFKLFEGKPTLEAQDLIVKARTFQNAREWGLPVTSLEERWMIPATPGLLGVLRQTINRIREKPSP